jgi:RimJ/RimL family protein N-acetyltransferase
MKLLPLYAPEHFELVAGWLAQKENSQWLDFGNGRQIVTPALLKIMTQRDSHFLRLYTADLDGIPIGLLGLNNVDPVFRTATFWGLSGDKSFRNRGQSTFASSSFIGLAFRDLRLRAVNTWAVANNPSIRTIERLGFRYFGRQRQCHCIDGQSYDRLLFDLLAEEYREIGKGQWRQAISANRELAASQ